MAISKHIIDLTTLALKDRVLTFVERKVIIDAAMKEGVSTDEINSYLDNALNERLRSYSKEDLKRCPNCGAQIPLVSDECPYCGQSLETADNKPTPPPYIRGLEADIIHSENYRVATERRNIRTCPDCGAPFPLVSNICENCGHVLHEQKESILNVKNLITNIQQSIDELKSTPQPTLWQVLWYRRGYLFFLVACIGLLVAAVFMSKDVYEGTYLTPLFGISIFFLVISVRAFVKTAFNSPVQIAEDRYDTAINRKEMFENHINVLYGKNPEATEVLGELSRLAASFKKKRSHTRLTILICLFLVIMVVSIGFILAQSKIAAVDAKVETHIIKEAKVIDLSLWDVQSPLTLYSNDASQYVTVDSSCTPVLSFDLVSGSDYLDYDSMTDQEWEFRIRVSNVKLTVNAPLPEDKAVALCLHTADGASLPEELNMPMVMMFDYSEYHLTFDEMLQNGCGEYYAEFGSWNLIRLYHRLESNVAQLRKYAGMIDSYSIYLINTKALKL